MVILSADSADARIGRVAARRTPQAMAHLTDQGSDGIKIGLVKATP
jgi:hypothetical protein